MGTGRSDLIDIDATLIHETEKAWLIASSDTGVEAWIAKSTAEFDDDTLTIRRSLAEEKGLI